MFEIRPHDFRRRPLWVHSIIKLGNLASALGKKVRLEKDDLIRRARRRTGLKDLGGDFWDQPLDLLLQSINFESRLHPLGRLITRERLVNLLTVRLRAEYWFKKEPAILRQPLYPVWLIAGLQRTGTTKLQRLLALDPDNRLLSSWEALNPAPWTDNVLETKKRIAKARLSERALRWMAPGFFAIHPVKHLEPEEDILLLDVSFMSTTPEATMHVPSYAAWVESADNTPAYRYLVKLLKLLQWQRPGKRWVLKSPHHLEFLSLADRHFPEMHHIWPHRAAEECIPSFLSMVAHSRSIFSDDVRLEEVTAHWVRKTGYMLQKGMAFRERASPGKVTDLLYQQLLEDTSACLQTIYGSQGLTVPYALRQQLSKFDASYRSGRHIYSPADFGLTPATLQNHMPAYNALWERLQSSFS